MNRDNKVVMREMEIKPNPNPPPILGEAADVEAVDIRSIPSIFDKEPIECIEAQMAAYYKGGR